MKILYYIIAVAILISFADARPHRVTQYPNGSIFQCSGCHINPNGGGTRNAFGKDVENHLSNGNVQWGTELASLDSDNDGFTNGEELLDPEGNWTIGDPDPGNAADVTKPYDDSDHPGTGVNDIAEQFINFKFTGNNVFQNSVSFQVNTELKSNFTIKIYNQYGQLIDLLYKGNVTQNDFTWNANNSLGNKVPSGLYFISVSSDKYQLTKKIMKL